MADRIRSETLILQGRYEVGRLIGLGSFAKVYHGRNLQTGDSVAVKVLSKEKLMKIGMTEQVNYISNITFYCRKKYIFFEKCTEISSNTDQARDRNHEHGETPEHCRVTRSNGNEIQDLLRDGAGSRWRALRQGGAWATDGRFGEALLPTTDLGHRFLP